MSFIMLVIIAIMIGYGITLAKDNIDMINQINQNIRIELDNQRTERMNKWEQTKNLDKNS
jgi:hypothetical protein